VISSTAAALGDAIGGLAAVGDATVTRTAEFPPAVIILSITLVSHQCTEVQLFRNSRVSRCIFAPESLLEVERAGTGVMLFPMLMPMPGILVLEVNESRISRPTIITRRRNEAYFIFDILVAINSCRTEGIWEIKSGRDAQGQGDAVWRHL